MYIYNCNLSDFCKKEKDRRIVLYGTGDYFEYYVKEHFPQKLINNICYFVDNGHFGEKIDVWGKQYKVFDKTILEQEKDICIIILSSNYMYEILQDIMQMNLDESVHCCFFPLMLVDTSDIKNEQMLNTEKKQLIPKVIHCFWFSGDEKPEQYQKCIDSWKIYCPDYEIKEWNMNNYDYKKNDFVRQAILEKKWAFASDYARLDVVSQYGGIYMDMDIELVQNCDILLKNEGFFSFDPQEDIDLGIFGAVKDNELVNELKDIYESLPFDIHKINWLCQPRLIRQILKQKGVVLNGETQYVNKNVFLARDILMPMNSITYTLDSKSDRTIAIHRFNAGWKANDYRNKRIQQCIQLFELMK